MTTGYIGEQAKRAGKAVRKTLVDGADSWPAGQRAWLAEPLGIEALSRLLMGIWAGLKGEGDASAGPTTPDNVAKPVVL